MSRRLKPRLADIWLPNWSMILAGVAVACLADASRAQLAELGVDFRISTAGSDPDLADAFLPAVDFNSISNEYLVTWHGDGGSAADEEFEIFGRRVDVSGNPLGNSFRISRQGTDGDTTSQAVNSAISYSAATNLFLVVWQGDGGPVANGEDEIFGQFIDETGALTGTSFRISHQGANGDPSFDARDAAVSYNASEEDFFVVWEGDGGPAADGEFEIFGQRLSRGGHPLGDNVRISNQGIPGSGLFAAREAAISYNTTANEFLVTWEGDGGPAADGENEIFGQRISPEGAVLGSDFRISFQGLDGDSGSDARDPAVSYNASANEYLVAWEGDGGPAADGEFEIFGQRVDAAGGLLGTNFRISHQGPDFDEDFEALDPAIVYNTAIGEFLVTWEGTATAGSSSSEDEIFGQRVSASGDLLDNSFRISNQGFDGDSGSDARDPATIYNELTNDFLVAWEGDGGLSSDEEDAIFGQLLKGPPLVPPPRDFNGNGLVEAADYTVWRDGLGTSYTAADYELWRANYGATSGAGSAIWVVPEPGPVCLSAVAMLFALVGRCRSRRLSSNADAISRRRETMAEKLA